MAYRGLQSFIDALAERDELVRIKTFADPVLEITEITDRVTKAGGKALLFENNGTAFPVLINAYGSDARMSMALGRNDLDDAAAEIEGIMGKLTGGEGSFLKGIASLPLLARLASYMPVRSGRRGTCQQVIMRDPDISILPVLKCWPCDGGRFITLPMVVTIHPDTGKVNLGMYRMQVLDKCTTAMHWQRHKTGASHFEAWKRKGTRMPVSVALGGDPVYTYSATAPLPENISEFILAGYLRKKKVRLVKCITNDLYVPEDADIILEGYVDPSEDPVWEGPFGDHTGFYSLADWYPKFHITCITHSNKAVYPATIVGVPPQEDAWLAKATEKIFLAPVRMTLQPEITDFHMPDAGVAHNLAIIKISKSYPGQGMKVISSLSGAGQMMFTKYLAVVSGEVDIRNYSELSRHLLANILPQRDFLFSKGPLDVLDHSSDSFSFGGKLGIDGTVKHQEETGIQASGDAYADTGDIVIPASLADGTIISSFNDELIKSGIPVLLVAVDSEDEGATEKLKIHLGTALQMNRTLIVLAVDNAVDISDIHMVAWQVLGNTDPVRDHHFLSPYVILLDGTIKAGRNRHFKRRWPNVVCSDTVTISTVDSKWDSLGIGPFIPSPSLAYMQLCREGREEVKYGEKGD